jgi:Ca-activated chloride channel family protein
MSMLWPAFLLLLGLIPLIIAFYVWVLRHRRRYTVRYSSLSLLREALPRHSLLRRHLPFALFLLALSSLIVAMGRPVAIVSVPTGQVTIILTVDVSRSMCSTDISPNRLTVAQQAMLSFIQRQPPGTQIGIVAFAGFAELIQPPTTDQELLQDAVESLLTGRRTGIGNGILKSIDAIAEIDHNVAPSVSGATANDQPTPVARGAFAPDIIVVLTDGVSNVGIEPLDAARQAVDRGIRVYTIGFGTANGSTLNCGGQFGGQFSGGGQFGSDPQFGGGSSGFRRGIDEETLKQVADMTDGAYYSAESAGELQKVFEDLPTYLITRHETSEISIIFAALGATLAVMALGLALLWNPLP